MPPIIFWSPFLPGFFTKRTPGNRATCSTLGLCFICRLVLVGNRRPFMRWDPKGHLWSRVWGLCLFLLLPDDDIYGFPYRYDLLAHHRTQNRGTKTTNQNKMFLFFCYPKGFLFIPNTKNANSCPFYHVLRVSSLSN